MNLATGDYQDLTPPGFPIRVVISLRSAGDMVVRPQPAGRPLAMAAAFFPGKTLRVVDQAHTLRVVDAEGSSGDPLPVADGLVTRDPELVLAVTVADCLPLAVADSRGGAFGLVHSGWKGTGIVREAAERLKGWGSRVSDLAVVAGPGIRPCCYMVDADRGRYFRRTYGEAAGFISDGCWRVDLVEANRVLLARIGVYRYTVAGGCTACGRNYGSFRREGSPFTKMLVLAGRS